MIEVGNLKKGTLFQIPYSDDYYIVCQNSVNSRYVIVRRLSITDHKIEMPNNKIVLKLYFSKYTAFDIIGAIGLMIGLQLLLWYQLNL